MSNENGLGRRGRPPVVKTIFDGDDATDKVGLTVHGVQHVFRLRDGKIRSMTKATDDDAKADRAYARAVLDRHIAAETGDEATDEGTE